MDKDGFDMRRATGVVLGLGLITVAAACGTKTEYTETNTPSVEVTSRTPEDVEVFTTQVPADRPYQEIGIIEARQATPASGHGQSEIIAELRALAAEKGCHGIVITGSSDKVVGSAYDGTGSVTTLKGYSATCIVFTSAAPKSAEGASAEASGAAEQGQDGPAGVAGFKFVMTADEARSACEGAGHTWTDSSNVAACSGPAESVGMSGMVQLQPCNDGFCQILVTSEPGDSELLSTVTTLKQALEKRYGAPATTNTALPRDCQQAIAPCVDEQRAYLEYIWTFDNGQGVKLRLGKKPVDALERSGTDHKLRLLYTRRAPKTKNQPVDDSTLAL